MHAEDGHISGAIAISGPAKSCDSNRLPVKKNRRFPDFLTPAPPLRCGGLGDRRRLAGCRRSEKRSILGDSRKRLSSCENQAGKKKTGCRGRSKLGKACRDSRGFGVRYQWIVCQSLIPFLLLRAMPMAKTSPAASRANVPGSGTARPAADLPPATR